MSGEGMKGPRLSRREILAGAAAAALAAGPLARQAKAESPEKPHEHPFGMMQLRDENGMFNRDWNNLRALLKRDHDVLAKRDTPAAQELTRILDEARSYRDFDRIRYLKTALQNAVSQQSIAEEREQYIREWRSPLEVLAHRNDCKGFAALNYFALGELGIAEHDRQICIVRDRLAQLRWNARTQKEEMMHDQHAVVALRHEGQWFLLDSMLQKVVRDDEFFVFNKKDWYPVYALDERGTWKFVQEFRNTAER